MSLSRRSFLKRATVAAASTATGAGPVKVASATLGHSPKLAALLSTTQARADIHASIARAGGFPLSAITDMFNPHRDYLDPSYCEDMYNRTTTSGYKKMRAKRQMPDGLAERLFEGADFNTIEGTSSYDFAAEVNFLEGLTRLPTDIPIMDILSEDVFEATARKFDKDSYGTVEALKEFLEPYCDNKTTVLDVMQKMQECFERAAGHMLNNPDQYKSLSSDQVPYNLRRIVQTFNEHLPYESDWLHGAKEFIESSRPKNVRFSLDNVQKFLEERQFTAREVGRHFLLVASDAGDSRYSVQPEEPEDKPVDMSWINHL